MAGNGGEDVELCVRLWRAGYLCLTVPSTSAAVAPTPRDGGWTDSVAFLHNRLRLGAVHLSEPRLGRFLAALAGHVAFPEAFGRVLAGDLGKRRAFVRGLSCFDDAWLFAHFGIQALEEARGESVSA
jgi:GT2 family glycosyltransferase